MYLLIFEDMSMQQCVEFNPKWIEYVSDGYLSVMKFEHGKFLDMDEDGSWYEPEVIVE